MTSVKSGEIFRIGNGHYSFLCIHCGFNFADIREILNHIDTHFDAINSLTDSIEDSKDPRLISDFNETLINQLSEMDTVLLEMPEIKIEIDQIKKEGEDDKQPINARRRKRIHRRKSTELISPENGENCVSPQQCPVCELKCDNNDSYKSHLRAIHHTFGNVYQCYMCGLYCRNLSVLKKHFSRARHSTTPHLKHLKCYQCESEPPITNETDSRPHKCFFCKHWYLNHQQFRMHFKNDHDQDVEKFFSKKENCNEFTCYICKKDFALKYYLKNHIIIHNENKKFVCDCCGKRYRTYAILRRHLNVHEGKTYKCDDCDKTFPYYARLRIHRYSHRTELNYKCTVCSKAFKVQKYLARHMLTHREEKKFVCRYCAKRFTFGTGRRAHEISQHNAV